MRFFSKIYFEHVEHFRHVIILLILIKHRVSEKKKTLAAFALDRDNETSDGHGYSREKTALRGWRRGLMELNSGSKTFFQAFFHSSI